MTTTAGDVWQLLAELVAAQKETERLLKEQSQETNQRNQETERKILAVSQEVSEVNKELSKQISAVNKQISAVNKQIGDLGGKWGRFVENMVAPACETIFLKRGIPVHQVGQRIKKRLNGQTLEIDVLVTNADHVLVVEVKSSLGVDDVKALIEDLTQFRQFFPEYNQKQLYGAVAGIKIDERSDVYATQEGLFLIEPAGDSVIIANSEKVKPRIW